MYDEIGVKIMWVAPLYIIGKTIAPVSLRRKVYLNISFLTAAVFDYVNMPRSGKDTI